MFIVILVHIKLKGNSSVKTVRHKREDFDVSEFVLLSCNRFLQNSLLSSEAKANIAERCNFVSNQLTRSDLKPVEKEALGVHISDCISLVRSQIANVTTDYLQFRNPLLKTTLFLTLPNEVNLEDRSLLLAKHSKLAMDHLRKTQDPESCQNPQILICDPLEDLTLEDFGSRVNFAVLCLAGAMATNRRLILKNPEQFLLFPDWFLPISANCQSKDGAFLKSFNRTQTTEWPELDENKPVVMTHQESNHPGQMPAKFPPNIPPEIGSWEEVGKVTSDPSIWYMGVLATFLTRLQYDVWHKFVDKARNSGVPIEAKKPYPYPSIHIPKCDKTCEPFPKYMSEVRTFYLKKHFQNLEPAEGKKVIVAMDDTKSVAQLATNYDQYQFVTNPTWSNTSSVMWESVYKMSILVRSELFVSTSSSAMARLIYLLRMARYPNAELITKFIDYPWFGIPLLYKAIEDHNSHRGSGELLLQKGDVIRTLNLQEHKDKLNEIKGSATIGLIYGFHVRTNSYGSFPAFKVVRIEQD